MRRPRAAERDRGSNTLETAILFPAVLLLVMAAIQAGLWYYGRSVALAAAQEGVSAGRAEGASLAQASQAASAFAADQGRGMLGQTSVSTAGSTAARVHVSVSGQIVSLVPGVPIAVSQEASGAVERWTGP
ncbi:TadE family protein [Nocardiopsis sp. CNT312]|uniref:TadE family protein n=1 Tax=Nocardiopsis sp. CNT312 TaxID=1137268 RepID=UPI00048BBA2B|nr:TadE family protein [Nocardiopsis sp. CNT312]